MKRQKKNKDNFVRSLLKGLAATGFSFVIVWVYAQIALNVSSLNPISEVIENFSITDKYYQMMPERESRSMTIVDLSSLYDRGDIALVLEEIEACRPAVVVMDCVFKGLKDSVGDNAIRQVAERYDNIVFSYELADEGTDGTGYRRSVHSFFSGEIPVHEGVANMQRDNIYSGIKRNLRLGWTTPDGMQLSMVGEAVNLYAGEDVVTAMDEDVNINFSPTRFPIIDPAEISQFRDLIEGRIVFFGAMTDQKDMHYTPLGKLAGVELLAYSAQTLLEHSQVIRPGRLLHALISIVLVLLTNILQLLCLDWAENNESPILHHVMGSAYVLGVATFLWIAVVMWITFLLFNIYHLNIPIGWSLAAMAFLPTSRSFLAACEDYYTLWKRKQMKP